MSDNLNITQGSGAVVATEEVASVHHQKVKVEFGGTDVATMVEKAAAKGLPVEIISSAGLSPLGEPTDAASTATDGTSASAIAILKQISSSLQTLAGALSFSSAQSITRTADANAYADNDVIGASVSTSAAIAFGAMGASAGRTKLTFASLRIDDTAFKSGEANYRLHLYSATPPSGLTDNAPFDLPSGDRASYLGFINFWGLFDMGSTLYGDITDLPKSVKLATANLFGYLVAVNGHTPSASGVYTVTLHSEAI